MFFLGRVPRPALPKRGTLAGVPLGGPRVLALAISGHLVAAFEVPDPGVQLPESPGSGFVDLPYAFISNTLAS